MATRTSTRNKNSAPVEGDLKVTPQEGKIESPLSEPVNLETPTPEVTPTAPAAAADPEKIQADIRNKLSNRDLTNDVFVPSNPAALEKAAQQVAQENHFDLNRGTSIGARLLARAQKKV
jgi:hypothetical protein